MHSVEFEDALYELNTSNKILRNTITELNEQLKQMSEDETQTYGLVFSIGHLSSLLGYNEKAVRELEELYNRNPINRIRKSIHHLFNPFK